MQHLRWRQTQHGLYAGEDGQGASMEYLAGEGMEGWDKGASNRAKGLVSEETGWLDEWS